MASVDVDRCQPIVLACTVRVRAGTCFVVACLVASERKAAKCMSEVETFTHNASIPVLRSFHDVYAMRA